jgi:hypothetical protein
MNTRHAVAVLGASLLVGATAPAVIFAQAGSVFGQINLPDTDFTWVWGNLERSRGREDISLRGSEAGFQCVLKTQFSPGNRMTMPEQRELEASLQTALYFIQNAAYTMNDLDFQREIEWATLVCEKPENTTDEAAQQERLEKLRERALRKSEKRIERRDTE